MSEATERDEKTPRMMQSVWPAAHAGRTHALDADSDEPRVVVDRRPRCRATFETVVDEPIQCDKHLGHEDEHESFYGWSGTSERWS